MVHKYKKPADLLRIGVERKKGRKQTSAAVARILHMWVDPQRPSGQSEIKGGHRA